jgi:hypothetical protein
MYQSIKFNKQSILFKQNVKNVKKYSIDARTTFNTTS